MIFVVFTFSEFLGIFVTKFSVRQAFRYTLLTETQPGVVSDHCYNSTYLDVILIKSNVHYHTWVLIPAPRLGVLSFFVVDSVCMYVRLSVTLFLQIDSSFLFLGGIKPFFGRHLSMWHSTKRCSSVFALGPLMPKIYSPKFAIAQNRL